tara:strand:- start:337 stop:546 length:210 start_codon:yes stop_codon:yes gene_type:complete
MKYRYHDYNIFLRDFKSAERCLGGYDNLTSSKIFDYWINDFTPNIHTKIKANIKKFILSKEYRLKSNWS